MKLDPIHAAIPHRDPFLLVDEIVNRDPQRILCRKKLSGDEFWFRGHYPQTPIMPGVLLCEAAMQAGAILLSDLIEAPDGAIPVATRLSDVKFKRLVLPGETIEMDVRLNEQLADAFFLTARVCVDGQLAARLDFACKIVTERGEEPQTAEGRN